MAFVNLKGEPVDVSGMTPVAVTGKPVPPQAPLENDPNPYLRATVPLTFQYQPDTLRQEPAKGFTQFRTPVLPASANAGVNAAAQNVTRNVENNSTTIAGLTWRGTWLSFANYSVNDVVVFNESTYVAIQASANTEPDTNTSVWSLVAENLVFNPVLPTAGFYGAFDQQAINSGAGNHGNARADNASGGGRDCVDRRRHLQRCRRHAIGMASAGQQQRRRSHHGCLRPDTGDRCAAHVQHAVGQYALVVFGDGTVLFVRDRLHGARHGGCRKFQRRDCDVRQRLRGRHQRHMLGLERHHGTEQRRANDPDRIF